MGRWLGSLFGGCWSGAGWWLGRLFVIFLIYIKCLLLSLVRIPFFIAPKLSQNNFKNQIVWEVLVGEVLVVGEVEKRAWILEEVHFIISAFPAPVVKFISARFPTLPITGTRLHILSLTDVLCTHVGTLQEVISL